VRGDGQNLSIENTAKRLRPQLGAANRSMSIHECALVYYSIARFYFQKLLSRRARCVTVRANDRHLAGANAAEGAVAAAIR
jgi:hypothetical protein